MGVVCRAVVRTVNAVVYENNRGKKNENLVARVGVTDVFFVGFLVGNE